MAKQSKLEEAAIAARIALLTKNTFNDSDVNNHYSPTHTHAISDDTTPNHGKGTGGSFDTANGGSAQDIHGIPNAAGSGRIQNLLNNEFNPENPYTHPDTEGNVGQVVLS
jgi:hypothetical protein